jgi:uncharacterized protein
VASEASDRPAKADPVTLPTGLSRVHDLPVLGPGLIYFPGLEPVIEEYASLVAVLEVEPQTLWLNRPTADSRFMIDEAAVARLEGLPGSRLVHSVGTPVGSSLGPDLDQVDLLVTLVERWAAPWASEHLAFNRAIGPEGVFSTGFFLPPRLTEDGVTMSAATIRQLSERLPVPLAVETGVNYLKPREDELEDGAFFRGVAEQAGCGLLLDLHNVWANERNGRQPVTQLLDQLPLESVWEVHMAGGFEHRGYWLDAHSGGIPGPLLDLARAVLPRLPNLGALLFEMVPSAMNEFGLEGVRGQLECLWDLWEVRGAPRDPTVATHPVAPDRAGDVERVRPRPGRDDETAVEARRLSRSDPGPVEPARVEIPTSPSPREWEETLGALVIGRSVTGELADELSVDPGIALLRHLILELRASTLAGTLKLTCRLLLLRLGEEGFRHLLGDYADRVTPRLFASDEGEAFGQYLTEADPEVPYLREVLAFELAVVATLIDGIPRTTRFEFEPISVLRELGRGRAPGPPAPGVFQIEVTGDEPGGDLDEYLARASYWPH